MSVAGLTPVAVEGFQGIRMDVDPEEVGLSAAIDLSNVVLDRRGVVRSRPGTTLFASVSANVAVLRLHRHRRTASGLPDQLVVGAAGTAYALNSGGTSLASTTYASAARYSMASLSTPTTTRTYLTDGNAVKYWDGSTFNTATGVPSCQLLATTPFDNRLVAGVADNDVSRLRFSDNDPGRDWQANTAVHAGDILTNAGTRYSVNVDFTTPATFNTTNLTALAAAQDTFAANNYVELTPGDGESLTALVAYNNQLFAFKHTKFFVFYGTSKDDTGNPVFNYRTVPGIGVEYNQWGAACAGPDGVYFLHPTGVYRTGGSVPVKVSTALDPLFTGEGSAYSTVRAFDPTAGFFSAMAWHDGCLWVVVPTATTQLLLIWDPRIDAWTVWDGLNVRALAPFATTGVSSDNHDAMFFGLGVSSNNVLRLDRSATTDNGTAITSFYRSGYGDLGHPAAEKTIRETEIVGTGTVGLGWSREFGTPDSAQSVSLGSTTPARGLDRHAKPGELLGYKLSSVAGAAWQVNRIVPMLREVRGVGERTS